MSLQKYLSSLRNTHIFMVCFGLLMGGVFPFYSWVFFGPRAFSPFYVAGCLTAGFLVGSFCYYLIRETLKLYVEQQSRALAEITGEQPVAAAAGSDQLQQLMDFNDALMERVLRLVANVSRLAADVTEKHGRLAADFGTTVSGNERQVLRGKETLRSVEEMNAFFGVLLREIEEIAARIDERASLSAQMAAATDAIAASIQEYSLSVMETSASIEQMAASIRETSANTEALSASTEQTYHSINAVGTSISEVRDNAKRSSDCSERVRLQALEGMEAMSVTIAAMQEIERNSDSSVDAMSRLSQHTRRVGEFLEVIKEVVSQSTLLSLNASIIAAQAGDRGRAFAVVAEEVRGLAKRTAASTEGIEDLVKNIVAETAAAEHAVRQGKVKVAEGVAVSLKANEALRRIDESAAEAFAMVQQIAAATERQASGSRVITEEAEKNLARVKELTRVIREEENGAGLVVQSLERMRRVSREINASTGEQARGNRLYMNTVQEDNAKAKSLSESCLQQIDLAEALRRDVLEVDRLLGANAREAREIMAEIDSINGQMGEMQREMQSFRDGGRRKLAALDISSPGAVQIP